MNRTGHPAGPLDRALVVELLAAFGDRAPESVDDVVGSLELTWLIAQVEERYSVTLDLSDAQLGRIATVADAADVLREALDVIQPAGETGGTQNTDSAASPPAEATAQAAQAAQAESPGQAGTGHHTTGPR